MGGGGAPERAGAQVIRRASWASATKTRSSKRLREPRAEVVRDARGAGGGLNDSRQFSTLRPFTRLNSVVLSVTTVSPRESAWAAMSMSFGPIGVPPASS